MTGGGEPMLRTLLIIVVVPAAGLLAYLALGRHRPRADFVLATPEPRTLDPARVSWLDEIQLTSAMFEGLTRLNAHTFQPEPAVARHWEISPDRTVYTFHLRPEARWSDGEPVLAADFQLAWLRVLEPECKAQYASLLFVIRGAEAYYRSRLNADLDDDLPAGEVGIEVLDPRTLRVTLGHPCSYFLELTSFVTFSPVHPGSIRRWAYRDGRVLADRQHLWARPGHMVCNGAFVLTQWDFKQSIWLQRNPYYWDRDAIAADTMEAWITDDPGAALIAYQTGRIDLVRGLERSVARTLHAQRAAGRRRDFHTGDLFATFFLRVNCRRPPLDNPDFRKALWLAIDRPALCEHILGLGEVPAYTYVPRTALQLMPRTASDGRTVFYQPPAGLGAELSEAERVELARQHLIESGFGREAAARSIELAFAPDPEQRLLAEAIAAMWESRLGIRVTLRIIEGKVLSSRIAELDYDLARSDWFGDYLDPATFLEMFTTGNGQNRTGWSSPEYDRLIGLAAREPDDARRFEYLQQAERILCEREVPIIPVFFRRGNYLLNPRLGGAGDDVRGVIQIHRLRPVP